ncbi:MAG: SIS domain-containing protein [Deltaproteobacteria bacterium]|nr:SIS domain-containing protein [Deltaproteobacteria bacterium]
MFFQFKSLRGFFHSVFSFGMITRFRWHFCCNVAGISAPAIIIFPQRANVLCCGIAGVIAVKRTTDNCNTAQELIADCSQLLETLHSAVIANDLVNQEATIKHFYEELLLLRDEDLLATIIASSALAAKLRQSCEQIASVLAAANEYRKRKIETISSVALEQINEKIVMLEDAHWVLERDILANILPIKALAGDRVSPFGLKMFARINFVLNSIYRLEVRGRDSAGVEVDFSFKPEIFTGIIKEIEEQGLGEDFRSRSLSGDSLSGSIGVASSEKQVVVSFTYKTFSVVGELGKNVRDLRERIGRDALLSFFAMIPSENDAIFSHTRWASVGAISEGNCHPLNNYSPSLASESRISVVLNGDIDNYSSLREHLEGGKNLIDTAISTDTKIIPLMVDSFLREGKNIEEAFRLALCSFEGSHAIAMRSSLAPGKIFLAQKGSGQTIYVGFAKRGYVFSSELYGLVEATNDFIRLDGEALSINGNSGQLLVLEQNSEGGLAGIRACFYDGTPLQFSLNDVGKAEMTTRDIDRENFPHYFLKEIMGAPRSVANTLMGKYRYITNDGLRRVEFNLGADVIPPDLLERMRARAIRDIFVIGHGTAGVAANAVAEALARYFGDSPIRVRAKIASELSGFHLEQDFSRALVIPITQSGTTTDTNRAVALARERGATIISIVNRRQSDITAKSHGVFYTSNGRDVEMSVASTKAFYSQIVAGHILGLALASGAGEIGTEDLVSEIAALERIVPAMRETLVSKHEVIKEAARFAVGGSRYWAIVGSGPNKIAADEIRIKLSELCYKTISTDIVEDKKHIDLSAEPLIIVCAVGTPESVLEDIVKDTAIFKAHRAKVIVFAAEGENRFAGIADAVIPLIPAEYPGSLIINTVAGHLWGYYAACFIDEEAKFFKNFRSKLNERRAFFSAAGKSVYEQLGDYELQNLSTEFSRKLRQRISAGAFSSAENQDIADILLLLKYAAGKLSTEDFWEEFGAELGGDIASPLISLDGVLKKLIESLSRPVDAIRHQAKTVTVGTSRKEAPLKGIIFNLLSDLGFSFRDIASRNALALMRVQPVIASLEGYTLYLVEGLDKNSLPCDDTTIRITRRAGVSSQMVSRTGNNGGLLGTKRTIVRKKDIYIGQGKVDGAPLVVFPLRHGTDTAKIFLLLIHVVFAENLPWEAKKRSLGTRYGDIRNLINEYNISWSEDYIKDYPLARLLGEQAEVIALEIKNTGNKPCNPGNK